MVECTETLEELSVCRNWLSANGALRVVEAVARRFAHGAQDEAGTAERMAQCTFNVDRAQHTQMQSITIAIIVDIQCVGCVMY